MRVDREGRILEVNEGLRKLTGYAAAELRAQRFFDLVRPQDVSEGMSDLAQALTTGIRWSGCVVVRRKDGDGKDQVLSLQPIGLRKTGPWHLTAVLLDVPQCLGTAADQAELAQRFSTVVNGSMTGLVVVQDGSIVFANRAAVDVFGFETSQDLLGRKFVDCLETGSKKLISVDLSDARALSQGVEVKGVRGDGTVVDLDIDSSDIAWQGQRALLISFRDVTERKRLEREQAAWFWEQEVLGSIDRQLASVIELPKMLEIIVLHAKSLTRADWIGVLLYQRGSKRAQWKVIYGTNEKPEDVFHRQFLSDLLKESLDPVFIPDIREAVVGTVYQNSVFGIENLVSIAWFPIELEGKIRGYLVAGYRKSHGFSSREVRLLGSLAEKSALTLSNTYLYENLRRHQEELEFLSSARIQAQEEERRRIATELHDGLGQILTAIKFNFEILEDTLPLKDDELRRFQNAKKLLEHAMREARDISYNLRPSILDDFGLVSALNYLAEHMSKEFHREVVFRSHGIDGRLEPEMETALYRIAQEALSNAIKHGQASHVDIQLFGIEKNVRMIVEDDGVGFSPVTASGRGSGYSGIGLVSMRERANSVLGNFDIESNPGKGTTVIVEVPLTTGGQDGKDSNTPR